jgi:hypothetical protein
MGTLSLIFLLLSLPHIIREMRSAMAGAGTPAPAGVVAGIVAFTGVFSLLLYVLLPAVLVWFHRKPDVQKTLAYFDQERRWTDNCPVPVLALSLWLVPMSAIVAAEAVTRPVLPLFGAAVIGAPAAAAYLVLAAVTLWLARATFRRRMVGWWATVAVTLLWILSSALTELRGSLYDAYLRAGYSATEIDALGHGLPRTMAALWAVVFWASVLCYLLYVRRFFVAASRNGESPAMAADNATPP